MKRFIACICIILVSLVLVSPSFARIVQLKSMPTDNNNNPAAAGSLSDIYYMAAATTGSPQEVTITNTQECKAFLVQVHLGAGAYGTAVPFNYARTDGGAYIEVPAEGLVVAMGIQGQDTGTSNSLGWVKAAVGYKIAVMLLY